MYTTIADDAATLTLVTARSIDVVSAREPARCAVCHDGGELGACPGCGTAWHADCRAGLATCPTLGCAVEPDGAEAPVALGNGAFLIAIALTVAGAACGWSVDWANLGRPGRALATGTALGCFAGLALGRAAGQRLERTIGPRLAGWLAMVTGVLGAGLLMRDLLASVS